MDPAPENMAVRLAAAAFGGAAESWLHVQAHVDLWHARRSLRGPVAKIARASSKVA